MLRAPVSLSVAGRTDRGVHALGQVCSYDGPLPGLRSVNATGSRSTVASAALSSPETVRSPGWAAQPANGAPSY